MNQGNESFPIKLIHSQTLSLQLVSTPLSQTLILSICFPLALAHRHQAELLLHLINFINGHSSFPFYISITSDSLSVKCITFFYSWAIEEPQALKKVFGRSSHQLDVPEKSCKLKTLWTLAQQAYNKLITLAKEHQIRQSVLAKESELSSLFASQSKLIAQLNTQLNQFTNELLAFLPKNQETQVLPKTEGVKALKKDNNKYTFCKNCKNGKNCQEKDTSCEQQLVRKDQNAGRRQETLF